MDDDMDRLAMMLARIDSICFQYREQGWFRKDENVAQD